MKICLPAQIDNQEDDIEIKSEGSSRRPDQKMQIKIQKEQASDEESKVCSAKSELGKRPVRNWERRWVLQPNVFDLNKGEIWV